MEVIPQQIEPECGSVAFESNAKFVGDIDTEASPDAWDQLPASGFLM